MADVLIFDVNETLLDMSALDPHFERAFGGAGVRREWFLTMQGLWMTGIVTKRFTPFRALAAAALHMVADRRGQKLDAGARKSILGQLEQLPPHADVHGALAALHAEGYRLAALTNSARQSTERQLKRTGLLPYLECVYSAEDCKRHKPASEPYKMALKSLGVAPSKARMIAAHAWDLAGAQAIAMPTAFVARPGKVLNPAGPKPDFEGPTIASLIPQIHKHDRPRRRRMAA